MTRRLVVGLTGGIGAGKSTAAQHFADLGAVVIDVDTVGRAVAEVGGRGHEQIVARFGSGVVADGALDRAALASIVFADPDALADLTAISHPAINETLEAQVAETPPESIVILDMAILVESALGRWGPNPTDGYEVVVVVETPLDARIERLVGSRGMDPADVRARIEAQTSDAERRAVADHVLSNDGDESALHAQVEQVWQALCDRQASG